MKAARKNNGRRTGQAGFSLIEILVVLVVLVIGILAIVRLFPAGFIALRNAQNSTFADRLGQAALESLKQDQGTLADAVYMYTDAGYVPGIAPDNVSDYFPAGAAQPDPAYGDINKQRFIRNETITVPAPHVIGNVSYPPLHALAFGPITLPTVPASDAVVPYLEVKGMPWAAIAGDSRFDVSDPNSVTNPQAARHVTNPVDVLAAGQEQFLADLGGGKIALPTAAYDRVFTFSVQTSAGATTVTLNIPKQGLDANGNPDGTGYQGGWFNTTNGLLDLSATPANGLPASTTTAPWTGVTIYRSFVYKGILPTVPAASGFSADPYQYCLYADNIGTGANMGVLAFNPLAAGMNGTKPLKAQVSYMALNWHVLHEDHDVPDGGGTVKLILDHLKKVGDVQFDQTAFGGLTTNTIATKQYDILMLDRDTGATYALSGTKVGNAYNSTYAGPATSTAPAIDVVDNNDTLNAADVQISYGGGRITLPASFGGKHLRIYYAGDADWAVAVQKAASVYNQYPSSGAAKADVTAINQTGANVPNMYVIDGTDIYFPKCDAGKTVEVDNIIYSKGGTTVTAPGGAVAISQDNGPDGSVYADLGLLGAALVPSGGTITKLNVRGVSARAVVIWHERNNWRTRATDTLLTRSQ